MDAKEKFLSDLSQEEREAIEKGEALAIPVVQPSMSGLFYASAAALIVAAMIAAVMLPPMLIITEAALVAALGWLTLYKVNTHVVAELATERRVLMGLIGLIGNAVDNQEDTKGTLSDNDGLSTGEEDND
jgi:hypothetical protein